MTRAFRIAATDLVGDEVYRTFTGALADLLAAGHKEGTIRADLSADDSPCSVRSLGLTYKTDHKPERNATGSADWSSTDSAHAPARPHKPHLQTDSAPGPEPPRAREAGANARRQLSNSCVYQLTRKHPRPVPIGTKWHSRR